MSKPKYDRICILCGKEIENTKQDWSKYCKKCYEVKQKKNRRDFYNNNLERRRVTQRAYREKNREKINEKQRLWKKKKKIEAGYIAS